jgi:hypothetical protein
MGAAGRRLVEERFSVARWGAGFAAAVAETARRAARESVLSLDFCRMTTAGSMHPRKRDVYTPKNACTDVP